MPISKKTRVLHIIIGLNVGGAERSLYTLVNSKSSLDCSFLVISLLSEGFYGPKMRNDRVDLCCCHLDSPIGILYLFNALARSLLFKPSIIHGWMYHGNIAAFLLCILMPKARLYWNIRTCIDDISSFSPVLKFIWWLNLMSSRFVENCVFNSSRSLSQHASMGFNARSNIVISNGFDCTVWRRSQTSRLTARQKFGLNTTQFVFGFVGRGHYRKDFGTLITAFNLFNRERPAACLVCVGRDLFDFVPEGADLTNVFFCGESSSLQDIYQVFDVLCLTSLVEGFPNVIGEAMACEVPCISTDVGDSKFIIGATGLVVDVKSPVSFSMAMHSLYDLSPSERYALGKAARKRIESLFSLDTSIRSYSSLYS